MPQDVIWAPQRRPGGRRAAVRRGRRWCRWSMRARDNRRQVCVYREEEVVQDTKCGRRKLVTVSCVVVTRDAPSVRPGLRVRVTLSVCLSVWSARALGDKTPAFSPPHSGHPPSSLNNLAGRTRYVHPCRFARGKCAVEGTRDWLPLLRPGALCWTGERVFWRRPRRPVLGARRRQQGC